MSAEQQIRLGVAALEYSIDSPVSEEAVVRRENFGQELRRLINYHSRENGSDTPDFVLAEYLVACLDAFDKATARRAEWYGDVAAE